MVPNFDIVSADLYILLSEASKLVYLIDCNRERKKALHLIALNEPVLTGESEGNFIQHHLFGFHLGNAKSNQMGAGLLAMIDSK